MPLFETKSLSLDELYLDSSNPRFITPPNATEQDIINYLIEYEEIEELVKSINIYHGLYAGERVIVCKENGRHVVLEGNRRIAACKILKDPQLLANYRPASAANLFVDKYTFEAIKMIECDIMRSRLSAQSALAAKHIDGIKKWSPISKSKFYAKEFEAGKTLQEIRDITGSSHATIKKGITEYNLINYALNLEEWLEKESELIVDINKLKVTPFTRVFSSGARNPNYPSLGKIINLDYDEKLHPVSSLPQEIFDHIIYLVAKSSFDKQIPFDTRSSLEDVVGLEEYLIMQGLLLNKEEDKGKINKESDKGLPLNTEKKRNGDQERAHAINLKKHESEMKQNQKSTNSNSSREKEEEKTKSKVKNNYKLTSSRQNVIPESFVIDSPHIRVNNIILELRKLNVNTYPNASAILLRVLLDLSTQCFLKEHSQEESIKKNDLQGTITNALNYMGNQKILDQKIIDNVRQAIKKERVINIFNCYAHYNEVMPMRQDLVEIFDNFAPYIEKCLKKQD